MLFVKMRVQRYFFVALFKEDIPQRQQCFCSHGREFLVGLLSGCQPATWCKKQFFSEALLLSCEIPGRPWM
jgi:hypothetical protein